MARVTMFGNYLGHTLTLPLPYAQTSQLSVAAGLQFIAIARSSSLPDFLSYRQTLILQLISMGSVTSAALAIHSSLPGSLLKVPE